jgi:RNA polymerase sigma factor (sigma-70 family)
MALQQGGLSSVFIHPGKRAGLDGITHDFHFMKLSRLYAAHLAFQACRMSRLEESLIENLHAFTAFARNRVGDPHLAEDLVQESLVKALKSANQPTGEEDTVTWFYRILRNSIIDLYRRDAARKRALETFESELPESPDADDQKVLCQCFKRLLPAIPENYRELIQRIDLDGEDTARTAEDLGLTRNNLTVRLHRARKHLREELLRNCLSCAKHGCLDCTCGENKSPGD